MTSLDLLGPGTTAEVQAFHSDPEDGELVLVVKEALAHLDHALLEPGMAWFWWREELWVPKMAEKP